MYLTAKRIREKFPNALIESGAWIESGAVISSGAVIERGVVIGSGAVIERGVVIKSEVRIERGAVIGVNRKGVTDALVINGIGTTRRMTAHTSDDGLVIVIGCLNDYRGETIEQARQAIAEKYSADHAYFVALDLAQRWYDQLEYTNTN
jgi:NDP-sugar pyrophosphorylase family protein